MDLRWSPCSPLGVGVGVDRHGYRGSRRWRGSIGVESTAQMQPMGLRIRQRRPSHRSSPHNKMVVEGGIGQWWPRRRLSVMLPVVLGEGEERARRQRRGGTLAHLPPSPRTTSHPRPHRTGQHDAPGPPMERYDDAELHGGSRCEVSASRMDEHRCTDADE
jgi:hypothetical protein